jgi:hypothetical protein
LYPAHIGEKRQAFGKFTLRRSPRLREDKAVPVKLYDARGGFRGEWGTRGRQHILLDAYRPEKLPSPGDWVLVLDATNVHPAAGKLQV